MSTFRVVKNKNFTVMSNHHLRNKNLSLKAKGLLSIMLSLPEDWDYTQKGLAAICNDGLSSIRSALKELEDERYLITNRTRDDKGLLRGTEYIIYEYPHDVSSDIDNSIDEKEEITEGSESVDLPTFQPICENRILDENEEDEPICDFPILDNPRLEKPILDYRMQLNKDILNINIINKDYNKDCDINNNHHITSNHIRDHDKGDELIREDRIRDEVKEQIEYELFLKDDPIRPREREIERDMAKEIYEIMVEYLLCKQPYIKISGRDIKLTELQSRLRSLTYEHIDYVIKSIKSTSKPVRNMKQYILASLYNAAVTYNCHAEVGMDLFLEQLHIEYQGK